MVTKNENIRPFKAVHPGSILKDELEARGMDLASFSLLSGISKEQLSGLTQEDCGVDAQMASQLEKALLIPASFWMSLQKEYEKDCDLLDKKKSMKGRNLFGKLPWNRVAF